MPDDWPGDQLRKERNIGKIVEQADRLVLFAVTVDQKRNLLKGEKADAERQDDVLHMELPGFIAGDVDDEETGVFVHGNQRQIGDDPGAHHSRLAGIFDQPVAKIVDEYRPGEQEDIFPFPVSIESDRPDAEHENCQPL